MATATAPAVSKSEQATHLRDQARTLNQELTQLRGKLAIAAGNLAVLNAQRQKFTGEAAAGQTPKSGAIAALAAEIIAAEIPFDGLTSAVKGKEDQLAQTKSALETLEREIFLEETQAARQARFDALGKQGHEVAAQISEMLRVLIEVKLPELDQVRDALTREFVNIGGRVNAGPGNPETTAARSLVHQLQGQFFDGPHLAVTRRLLRAGWTENEFGPEFIIKTLRPRR